MRVSVVVTTHNGRHFLAPCLEALERCARPPGVELEVIVVDNGSSDQTGNFLKAYPWVKPLVYAEALGFARANNKARAVATGDVVCFLNNDTAVERDWLARPLEILAHDPDVAAVGAKLVYMHRYVKVTAALRAGRVFVAARVFGNRLDTKIHWRHGGGDVRGGVPGYWLRDGDCLYLPQPIPGLDPALARPPVLEVRACDGGRDVVFRVGEGREARALETVPGIVVLDGYERREDTVRLIQNAGSFINALGEGGDVGAGEEDDGQRLSAEELCPSLCGGCLFVRREDLDAVGWFPDYYKMYYEDTDLCLQLRQRGKLLVYCPSSRVNHYHTGTSREWSPFFVENVTRSALLFATRHGTAPIVRRRVRETGLNVARGLLRAARQRSMPWEVWGATPELRGAALALPGLLRAGLGRATSGPAVRPLPIARQPYVFRRSESQP